MSTNTTAASAEMSVRSRSPMPSRYRKPVTVVVDHVVSATPPTTQFDVNMEPMPLSSSARTSSRSSLSSSSDSSHSSPNLSPQSTPPTTPPDTPPPSPPTNALSSPLSLLTASLSNSAPSNQPVPGDTHANVTYTTTAFGRRSSSTSIPSPTTTATSPTATATSALDSEHVHSVITSADSPNPSTSPRDFTFLDYMSNRADSDFKLNSSDSDTRGRHEEVSSATAVHSPSTHDDTSKLHPYETGDALVLIERQKHIKYKLWSCLRGFIPAPVYWIPKYRPAKFLKDLIAGLTIGVMLVPQGMAYGYLAGLPAIYGLYASFVPPILYALLGSSMQLTVGPVAITAMLTATGAESLAPSSDEDYIRICLALALVSGLILIILGICNIGFIVEFMAAPVLSGFISASGVIIIASQIPAALGITISKSDYFFVTVYEIFKNIASTNVWTLLIALICLVILITVRYIKYVPKWFPTSLILMGLGILFGWLLDLEEYGVDLVGEIPSGLPKPFVPSISGKEFKNLLMPSFILALMGYVGSIALAKKFAALRKTDINSNAELYALGLANFGGAFFQSFPVGASLSRTAINNDMGAQTPVSNVVTGLVVMCVLLFATAPFVFLPKAILAAIVISTVYTLVDYKQVRPLWTSHKQDAFLLAVSFLSTLAFGIQYGIFAAVGFSMLMVFYRSSSPNIVVLGRLPGSQIYKNARSFTEAIIVEGIAIVRIDADLYFANIAHIKSMLWKIARGDKELRAIILDGNGINFVDSSATNELCELVHELQIPERKVQILLACFHGYIIKTLVRTGLITEIERISGRLSVFGSVHDAVEEVKKRHQLDVEIPALVVLSRGMPQPMATGDPDTFGDVEMHHMPVSEDDIEGDGSVKATQHDDLLIQRSKSPGGNAVLSGGVLITVPQQDTNTNTTTTSLLEEGDDSSTDL
ncbi:solute carrier 26 family protein [Pelomyxa schiedti]|nr:solute carrier 26 family protein [Pelomyxa schiedti]